MQHNLWFSLKLKPREKAPVEGIKVSGEKERELSPAADLPLSHSTRERVN